MRGVGLPLLVKNTHLRCCEESSPTDLLNLALKIWYLKIWYFGSRGDSRSGERKREGKIVPAETGSGEFRLHIGDPLPKWGQLEKLNQ